MWWDSTTSAASSGGGDDPEDEQAKRFLWAVDDIRYLALPSSAGCACAAVQVVMARLENGSGGRISYCSMPSIRKIDPFPADAISDLHARTFRSRQSGALPPAPPSDFAGTTARRRKQWPREVLLGHRAPPPHLAVDNLPPELLVRPAPPPGAGEADHRSSPTDSSCTMQQRGWDGLERCGGSGGDGNSDRAQRGQQQLRAAPTEKGLRAPSTIRRSSATQWRGWS
uniref:Uncharacterized protein n=1 Tax=Setaria viridis TaxID=4556 RepID=A0A4U6VY63_SETVI|nr:hypothetical protein SEVIR_2G340500v2 [Setaria viridis]